MRAGVVDKTSRQLISDKATAKVLAVHSNAPDSSFLVSQGHKIRKLVDAYVKQICSRK